jgi:hypothetical protein
MKEKKDKFFIRQHIYMKPKATPSNNPNNIRLKFLETPYRLYHKMPRQYRLVIFSAFLAALVPFTIYQSILAFVRYEKKVIIPLLIKIGKIKSITWR